MKALLFLIGMLALTTPTCYADSPERLALVMPDTEAPQNDYEVLKGYIGSYPVTMYLDSEVGVNKVCGYLIYDRFPQNSFKLKVVRKKAWNATRQWGYYYVIHEISPQGKHTGTFNGTYSGRQISSFDGTFTNEKGKKFKFSLELSFN